MRVLVATSILLPAFVAAVPLNVNSVTSGIVVPLTKKINSIFVGEDGLVDLDYVLSYIKRTTAKYVDNSDGLISRGIIKLDDSSDVEWTGKISIGTPPREFTALFDTGSSDLVVPTSQGCNGCFKSISYDPTSSSTSKALNKTFVLSYGSGTVSGTQYNDTITVANLTAKSQTIMAANHSAEDFFKNMNALVGLSFGSLSTSQVSPLVQTLRNQKKLPNPVFGFKLTQNGSELSFGSLNNNAYTGKPTYAPVKSDTRWQISFDKMTLWNKTLPLNNTAAIVDSGTSLILADPKTTDAFYASFYGAEKMDNGLWSVTCYNIPQISVVIGGKEIVIPTDVFTLGVVAPNSDRCLGGIQPADGLPFWVLGDTLMRNVYTIFDVAHRRVGFADLK